MAPIKRMDIADCKKEPPPHPCDPPKPCDPWKEGGICPEPYLCKEKIKHPALPGEATKCKPGASIPAKTCKKQIPPHPCDPLAPCSSWTEAMKAKKPDCEDTVLCRERIKNPDDQKKPPACDPNK